jgi:hypothetical protein
MPMWIVRRFPSGFGSGPTAGWFAALLAVVFAPSVARAQSLGFVGGGTVDPEQVYAGVFFETPPIAQQIRLRPGFDASRGDGLKIASINLDILYRTVVGSQWEFYTGGGPTIARAWIDDSSQYPKNPNFDDVSGGLEGLIGFAHKSGLLFEFKFGHTNLAPNLKFGVGFKFGGGP